MTVTSKILLKSEMHTFPKHIYLIIITNPDNIIFISFLTFLHGLFFCLELLGFGTQLGIKQQHVKTAI